MRKVVAGLFMTLDGVVEAVLATSDIRSENRRLENGISSLYRLQTKKGKGEIGNRQ